MTTATKSVKLELYNSDSPQNPTEFSGWKVYTFGLGKITDAERSEYVKEQTSRFGAKPTNGGLAARLKAGTAFWLSYYEHGDGALSLIGEGTMCDWDTTGLAGIIVWEEPLRKLPAKNRDTRSALARNFLSIYNQWANGHVYSWNLLDDEGDDIDGCSECYDEKEMFESIRTAVAGRPVELEGEAAWLARFYGEGLEFVDEDGDPVDMKSF